MSYDTRYKAMNCVSSSDRFIGDNGSPQSLIEDRLSIQHFREF